MEENNKRFTIDWNKEKDGTMDSIMVFDHSKSDTDIDCPYSTIAMYDSFNIARFVGSKNYKTLKTWQKAVNGMLCIDIDWKELESKGSIEF